MSDTTTRFGIAHKTISIIVAFALCMSMTTLSACSSSSSSTQTTDEQQATGPVIYYNEDGEYSVEITSDFLTLDGKNTDDLQVTSDKIDYDSYDEALKEQLKIIKPDEDYASFESDAQYWALLNDLTEDEWQQLEDSLDIADYTTIFTAEVTVAQISGNTLTLSFKDSLASTNLPDYYYVQFGDDAEDDDSDKSYAQIYVVYPEFIVTPDIDQVTSSEKQIKVTFTLDDSEFKTVTADDLELVSSFANLNIDSVSASGKNLTMQLSGDLVADDVTGVYLDGGVNIAPSAIKNATKTTQGTVDVVSDRASFDTTRMTFKDGVLTVPFVTANMVDVYQLTKDSFAIDAEGIEVTSVTPVSDTEATLEIKIKDATSINEAADAIEGCEVSIYNSEVAFEANTTSASFYPVFDYVGDAGDGNLEYTLILYSRSGTFVNNIEASDFSFGQDFEGASVTSANRTSDDTVELTFSAPAPEGQSVDSLDVDGAVTIAAGKLTNNWGTPTDEEYTYARNYSKDSLGRAGSEVDILNSTSSVASSIASANRDNIVGTVGSYVAAAISLSSTICGILEAADVISTDSTKVKDQVAAINAQVGTIYTLLLANSTAMDKITANVDRNYLNSFDTNLDLIDTYVSQLKLYLTQENLSTLGINVPTAGSSDELWATYNSDIMDAIAAAEAERNPRFVGFTQTMNNLKTAYDNVTSALSRTGDTNPIYVFNEMCTYTYNFSTQVTTVSEAYKVRCTNSMYNARNYLLLYYKFGLVDNSPAVQGVQNQYNSAKAQLDSRTVGNARLWVGIDNMKFVGGEAYCYVTKSDIRLSLRSEGGMGSTISETERAQMAARLYGATWLEAFQSVWSIMKTKDGESRLATADTAFGWSTYDFKEGWYTAKARKYRMTAAVVTGWNQTDYTSWSSNIQKESRIIWDPYMLTKL